jgi:hypothetical protein
VTIEPAPGVTNPILDGGGTNTVLTVANNMYLVIDGVTIQHGGNFGSGIANDSGGTLSVTGSTFTGNNSAHSDHVFGGAIENGFNSGTGTLTVNDSTFASNFAYDGGAIDNGGDGGSGTLTVNDSTFTGNSARDTGGAIDNADTGIGTVTVTGSTFTSNTANRGGAISNVESGGTGSAVVAADIFAGGCGGTGTWTDEGYNVGSDTSCQNGGTGDTTLATLASQLGPLANNGGPTQTMRLLLANPAAGLIPNGTGVLCPLAADQTGLPSPVGAPCNAGALQPHPIIKSVTLSGTASAPMVTIKGRGFGTLGNLGHPVAASSCGGGAGGTGADFTNTISVVNHTKNWNAGEVVGAACSYIGLVGVTYYSTEAKVTFKFGSDLAFFGGLKAGNRVTVTLLGAAKTITAAI